MAIEYTDGAPVEAEILEILSREPALGATDAPGVDKYDASWPVQYHLSPERANLLRHLDFSGLDVLELGAGMGALSRHIAENARHLEVVEGTEERYTALAQRLKGLDNWSGRVGNIAEIPFERRHDVVTVIGVLEYCELYVTPPEGHTPFSWFLHRAAEGLKDDGVLVLAIENRLGLKYWNGAVEDHTWRLYDGICGYPLEKTPRTFSRAELKRLLAVAGFGIVEEYFPFPDYKLPSSVLTREFMEGHPSAAAALASTRSFENPGLPRIRQFPEGLALESLAPAGLLTEMANSFLFVATRKPGSKTLSRLTSAERERGERAWHYGCRRRVPTRTTFVEKEREISVRKDPLKDGTPRSAVFSEGNLTVHWTAPAVEGLTEGTPLRQLFARKAYFNDAAGCRELLDGFLRWSFARWHEGDALDAIVTNAVYPYRLFDLEWRLEGPMEKSWFILRNVLALYADRDLFPREAPFRSPAELYGTLCRDHGIDPQLTRDIALEARLQALVTDRPSVAYHRAALEAAVHKSLTAGLHPRWPTEEERAFLSLLQSRPLRALGKLARAAKNTTWLKSGAKTALRLLRKATPA